MLNIAGLDKAKILQALYRGARPQGLGVLHYEPGGLSDEDAERMIRSALQSGSRFDYVQGRVMKINLTKDEIDPVLYDRDNGEGAAAEILKAAFPEHPFE